MKDEQKVMLLWKVGPGDANKALRGENPCPEKTEKATADSWQNLGEMPKDSPAINMGVSLTAEQMDILCMGHIPQVQEDHWFMYADDRKIRYYRSWTGIPVFEAEYEKTEEGYKLGVMTVNLECGDVPLPGPQAAGDLFMCLSAADMGLDWYYFWEQYVSNFEEKK